MREVLDRLREAETALNKQLHDTYFSKNATDRTRALGLFWKAKEDIWFAQMHVLDAFRGHVPDPEI